MVPDANFFLLRSNPYPLEEGSMFCLCAHILAFMYCSPVASIVNSTILSGMDGRTKKADFKRRYWKDEDCTHWWLSAIQATDFDFFLVGLIIGWHFHGVEDDGGFWEMKHVEKKSTIKYHENYPNSRISPERDSIRNLALACTGLEYFLLTKLVSINYSTRSPNPSQSENNHTIHWLRRTLHYSYSVFFLSLGQTFTSIHAHLLSASRLHGTFQSGMQVRTYRISSHTSENPPVDFCGLLSRRHPHCFPENMSHSELCRVGM